MKPTISRFFNHRIVLLLAIMLSSLTIMADKYEDGKDIFHADGPYIIYKGKSVNVISANNKGDVANVTYTIDMLPKSFEVLSEEAEHRFSFALHPIEIPANTYAQPSKIFVLSDPHGDFDAFVSILRAGNVINENYQWTYGNGHLVVIGDSFDRGVDVLPILWLCYKLENEAAASDGKLHYIIGNHEDMVLSGNDKYSDDKYEDMSSYLKVDYKQLFDKDTELGRWLRSRNFIEKIGNNLFVHAGLSKEFLDKDLSLNTVNDTMRHYLGIGKNKIKDKSSLAFFLFDKMGPIWYRGLVRPDNRYSPIEEKALADIIKKYGVERIIVGHTIFENIGNHQHGKVIDVNVKNDHNRRTGKDRAIIIEGNDILLINDAKEKTPLPQ